MKILIRVTVLILTGLFILILFRVRELLERVERLQTSVAETVTLADVTRLIAAETK